MNNAMIDLALGMVLMYAVLSLFVTTLQEFVVNALLRSRGSTLKKLVRSAFGEDKGLTEAFFQQPLIVSLAEGTGRRRPSYIPPTLMAKGFLAVLGHGEHPARSGMSPRSFVAALRAGGQAPASAGRVVGSSAIGSALALATSETQDWEAFEKEVAVWIASIGDRSEGWYKRTAQGWTFGIALALAMGLNVDSVSIARTLWSDAELRTQLAEAAVAVNAARQSGASAPAAAQTVASTAAPRDFAGRYEQVEKSLGALETALRDKSFLQEDQLFTFKCTVREKTCVLDLRLGRRCKLDRRFTPEELAACVPADPGGKPAQETTPATEWLDDLHALREELREGRVQASKQGARLERTQELENRIDTVDQTLAHIIGEMQWLSFKLPDPNGKAARTMAGLTRSALDLQREIAQLYRTPGTALGRVRAECGLSLGKDTDEFRACVLRRDGETTFHLPMGFAPEVLARQLSLEDLKACESGQCGTLGLLCRALRNGALLGWLLTATALSLGAPFWFDTLGRLVKLRAAGAPTKETDGGGKGGDAKTSPPTTAPAPGPGPTPGPAGGGRSGTSDHTTSIEGTLSVDEIKEVQRRLSVPDTGVWDERTRLALAQRREALRMPQGAELDGSLYEAIMERRSLLVEARPVLKLGSQSDQVPALRTRLSQALALPELARGQGEGFDSLLRDAVRLYQGRSGLVPDGVVGEQTWRALDSGGGDGAADVWMKRAISALGLNEVQHKAEIRAMLGIVHEEAQDPATYAWCACFVSWVLSPRDATGLPAAPMRAANWSGWGTAIDEPCYGAVLLLRNRAEPSQHHLAFLVGEVADGWVVLGGNQGTPGKVSVTLFSGDHWERAHMALPPAGQT